MLRMHVLVAIAVLAVAGVAGCGNDTSSPSAPQEDTTPPSGVASLHARVYTVGHPHVALNWSANFEPDLASYRVYRTVTQDEAGSSKRGYERVAAMMSIVDDPTTPGYVDYDVILGARYGYAVSAVDHAGNESTLNEVTVLVIPPPGHDPGHGVD